MPRRRAYQMRCVSRKRVSSYLAVSGRNNCFQLRFRVVAKKIRRAPEHVAVHELPLGRLYHRKTQTRSFAAAKENIYSRTRVSECSFIGAIEFAFDSSINVASAIHKVSGFVESET